MRVLLFAAIRLIHSVNLAFVPNRASKINVGFGLVILGSGRVLVISRAGLGPGSGRARAGLGLQNEARLQLCTKGKATNSPTKDQVA